MLPRASQTKRQGISSPCAMPPNERGIQNPALWWGCLQDIALNSHRSGEMHMETLIGTHWHDLPREEVAALLKSETEHGLDILEVRARQEHLVQISLPAEKDEVPYPDSSSSSTSRWSSSSLQLRLSQASLSNGAMPASSSRLSSSMPSLVFSRNPKLSAPSKLYPGP